MWHYISGGDRWSIYILQALPAWHLAGQERIQPTKPLMEKVTSQIHCVDSEIQMCQQCYSSGHYKVNVPLSFYDRNTELYVLNKRKPFVKTEAEIVNRYTWCERLDAHWNVFATIVEIEMDAAIDITQTNSTAMAKSSKFKPPVSVRKAIALVCEQTRKYLLWVWGDVACIRVA